MIASIIDDSHCWMSDVAFPTAPPIGGLSCLSYLTCLFVMGYPLAGPQLWGFLPLLQHFPLSTRFQNVHPCYRDIAIWKSELFYITMIYDRPELPEVADNVISGHYVRRYLLTSVVFSAHLKINEPILLRGGVLRK